MLQCNNPRLRGKGRKGCMLSTNMPPWNLRATPRGYFAGQKKNSWVVLKSTGLMNYLGETPAATSAGHESFNICLRACVEEAPARDNACLVLFSMWQLDLTISYAQGIRYIVEYACPLGRELNID